MYMNTKFLLKTTDVWQNFMYVHMQKICSVKDILVSVSQISMSGELTTAKTHLASLQNEVTSLRQKEAELSSQLSKVTSEAEKFRNELTRTKDSHTGLFACSLTHSLLESNFELVIL